LNFIIILDLDQGKEIEREINLDQGQGQETEREGNQGLDLDLRIGK